VNVIFDSPPFRDSKALCAPVMAVVLEVDEVASTGFRANMCDTPVTSFLSLGAPLRLSVNLDRFIVWNRLRAHPSRG
jgi:hypothetical protein